MPPSILRFFLFIGTLYLLLYFITRPVHLRVLKVKEIVALAKGSNYQVACQRHFDVTHPGHQQLQDLAVSEIVTKR